jgi:hypothetical protein
MEDNRKSQLLEVKFDKIAQKKMRECSPFLTDEADGTDFEESSDDDEPKKG